MNLIDLNKKNSQNLHNRHFAYFLLPIYQIFIDYFIAK